MSKAMRFTDELRATAVAALTANGYPGRRGALEKTAAALGVNARTLSRWFNGEQHAPPDKLVSIKKLELAELIDNETRSIFDTMKTKRGDATYSQLAIAVGILFDKRQLLIGGATSRPDVRVSNEIPPLPDDQLDQILGGLNPTEAR